MGERCQSSQPDQAGLREVPAVGGLQVLQGGKLRTVLQRRVRQPLVALPAASQLLHAEPEQARHSAKGKRGTLPLTHLSTADAQAAPCA